MEVRADRRHTGRKSGRETALQIRHPAIDRRRSPSPIPGPIFWDGFHILGCLRAGEERGRQGRYSVLSVRLARLDLRDGDWPKS